MSQSIGDLLKEIHYHDLKKHYEYSKWLRETINYYAKDYLKNLENKPDVAKVDFIIMNNLADELKEKELEIKNGTSLSGKGNSNTKLDW